MNPYVVYLTQSVNDSLVSCCSIIPHKNEIPNLSGIVLELPLLRGTQSGGWHLIGIILINEPLCGLFDTKFYLTTRSFVAVQKQKKCRLKM